MLGTPTSDRVSARRRATKAEILDAVWAISRERGLAAVSLREVARRVGMKAPSLYEYFDSKNAIYDAMFAQGYADFMERMRAFEIPDDPVQAVQQGIEVYFDFCSEDAARYQLMFQRTIPGFEPSEESYAFALEAIEITRRFLADLGISNDHALDALTAMSNGLAAQQAANEPGGSRWRRLAPRFAQMFSDEFALEKVKGEGR